MIDPSNVKVLVRRTACLTREQADEIVCDALKRMGVIPDTAKNLNVDWDDEGGLMIQWFDPKVEEPK